MKDLPKSLTQTDFETVADFFYRVTSEFVRDGQDVVPMLVAGVVRDGEISTSWSSPVPLRNDRDRERLLPFMHKLVQRPELDFVVHITEAWLLMLKDQPPPKGSIAKHPQRQETVIFNILSKDCQVVVINPLRRDPSKLERGAVDFGTEFQGRMARQPPIKN